MNEIKMSCDQCVFAEYLSVGGKQVQYDCMLGRIKKLNPEENFESDENKSWFVSNRFCNTARPQSWLDEHYEGSIEKGKTGVLEEVKPRLSIIIDFNYDEELLFSNLDKIDKDDTSRKFVTIINDKIEYNMSIIEKLSQLHSVGKIVDYNILMPIDRSNIYNNIDECIRFCKNGWIVFISSGDTIPSNLTSAIDKRINHDLKRLVYCSKDNPSFVIQAAIYKLLNGNQNKICPDGTIDTKTFLERVSELKSEDPDCIITWSDLFNG